MPGRSIETITLGRQVLLAAGSVPAALALVLLAAWVYAGLILDRHQIAAWDSDWLVTEPQWTGRTQGSGNVG